MRVLITGGSGLIGRQLVQSLLKTGDRPVVVSRRADELRRDSATREYEIVQGDPTKPGRWQETVDGTDAVVNLVGQNIFSGRWNAKRKQAIRDSRVYGTENVVAAIRDARNRPAVLVQGSAVGYYGPRGDEEVDESAASGADFLAVVSREWEDASAPIDALGVRRAIVRTGIVLAAGEGALKTMTPLFQLGPGLPIGSDSGFLGRGRQWMSWIHIDDIVGLFRMAIENPDAAGPINGVAPHPVRNVEFSKAMSNALWKPYTPWRVPLPIGPPDFLLQLVLGELADVVTTGQRAIPKRAAELNYRFKHPELAAALNAVFKR